MTLLRSTAVGIAYRTTFEDHQILVLPGQSKEHLTGIRLMACRDSLCGFVLLEDKLVSDLLKGQIEVENFESKMEFGVVKLFVKAVELFELVLEVVEVVAVVKNEEDIVTEKTFG